MEKTTEDNILSQTVHDFFEAVTNLFIFFPYFFSITTLLKTLFSPWKNLSVTEKARGFSLDAWFNKLSFNVISRGMGFVMRISLILFYLLVQLIYIILLPFIIILFFILLPFILLWKKSTQSELQKKVIIKKRFIESHLLSEDNFQIVEDWAEYYYQTYVRHRKWWKLQQLFSIPPLGRDWAQGYTPTLDQYAEDFTHSSYQLRYRHHIIDREKETKFIEQTLSKTAESNALIVGEKGVGKHTILNAFARKVYEGKVNSLLAYKRILNLNMEKILTEHTDLKKREEFMEQLLKEAIASNNVILIIDNFDRYVAPGEDRIDLSAVIEKYATTSQIQIIGITTPFAYEKFIFPNPNIRSIFTRIDVKEITKEVAHQILFDQVIMFENRYKITIPYETTAAVIDKSQFYITTIPFPEKALQLMDNICVYATQEAKKTIVTPDMVDAVLTKQTHVPTSLSDQIKDKLLHLESLLQQRILGQNEAINEISTALRRSFILLGKRMKPLASFLFLGPTGVGKTETSKVIAEVFFGSQKELIRFDMSLYQNKNDIPKLIGSVESLNPGLLTNAIRENPYGVLLLDEIEKAHADLLNIFLTILDEGYFTDGYGQKVDCKNLVIIATSNAGADHIPKMLSTESTDQLTTTSLIDYLVENHLFSPEFLNRFDGVVAYKPLQKDIAIDIARRMVDTIDRQIFDTYKVHIQVSDMTLQQLTDQGYNIQYGARNLERVMRQQVEDVIAKKILANEVHAGETISL